MVTARIALPAPSMSLTRLYLSFVIAAIAVMLAGIAHAGSGLLVGEEAGASCAAFAAA